MGRRRIEACDLQTPPSRPDKRPHGRSPEGDLLRQEDVQLTPFGASLSSPALWSYTTFYVSPIAIARRLKLYPVNLEEFAVSDQAAITLLRQWPGHT